MFGQKNDIGKAIIDTTKSSDAKTKPIQDFITSIEFINKTKVIIKKFGDDTVFYTIPLQIITKDTIKNETYIKIKDEFLTATAKDCHLYTRIINLKPNKLEKEIIISQIVIAVFSSKNVNSSDVAYRITASINSLETDCILNILHPKELYTLDFDDPQNFIVNIGSNFDFSNGIQANSLYAKVSVFSPNLVFNRLGLYSGMYQNSFISKDSTTNGLGIDFLDMQYDTISFIANRISYKSTSKTNNVALFIGMPVRLTKPSKYFNLYWSPEFEIIKVNNSLRREYNIYHSDTLLNKTWPYFDGYTSEGILVNPDQVLIISQYYLKHFGIANFILTIEDDKKSLFLLGTLWGYANPSNDRKSYYQFKFEISEKKYGISLGGEFRGFYSSDPYIGIHLSKLFNLSKLIEYN